MITRRSETKVDPRVRVGSVELPGPVMTASGTSGHGAELAAFMDLARLGAVVVKSLSADPWLGNPEPRVVEAEAGMINSVGLSNPGVARWIDEELAVLVATGARVVASIWGSTVAGYARAADLMSRAPVEVVAVEVNLSCPNLDGGQHMFAHSPEATAEVIAATAGCGRPRWAKLSPNVTDIRPIAEAALDSGAEALTLVNTVRALALDPVTGRPRLGAGPGGLSGPAIRPVAVRAVAECRDAFPDAAIIGVGGITRGVHAAEMMVAGANAVAVGTATFADPRAPARVQAELIRWCVDHRRLRVADLGRVGPTNSRRSP
ncbi:MAG: dihydroorotate dehydrogenase [Acidimicrobiales bacterium]